MTTLDYRIEIAKPLTEVYNLACQVERQPEFIPDYLSCAVIAEDQERKLLERSAKIRGKVIRWESWVRFQPNEGVYFTHKGGRLDGMQVQWRFAAANSHHTQMTITQKFHVRHWLPGVGPFLEQRVFGPKLKDMAQRVIQNFKKACEAQCEAVQ